ncbi:mitochondrial carrier domain-containing protein [Mucor mucedo]|uniref:mitochondrial carrier domain-containing protein n=1 Tax=Mucor mucedo TaxID=29922 RepID=UPI00221F1536|nr:mitochondrial carrier domain-containing protein [Mucor mucedo]KAI7892530.1 mitochondrial carrier domain-containing protein [Mucor mucedo]
MASAVEQFKIHFLSGATGLSLSYACMHPIDTIKTRIQADPSGNWRQVVFSKSTLHSLGKGFFVSALGAAGQGGARFSTYEFCKSKMLPKEKNALTIPVTALSAVLGDLASSVIKVPREVITAKLQIDHYKANAQGIQPNAAYVIRQTLIEEGPKGLFRGFWAIAARDSPFMVILLVSYENFKAFHHRSVREALEKTREYRMKQHGVVAGAAFEELEADIPTMRSILYGGISGSLAGYFTTPMDVLRTRVIAQKATSNAMSVMDMSKYMVAKAWSEPNASSFKKSINTCNAFFVGAVPRSVWWFGICGIFFPTYETLKSLMNN